MVCTTSSQWNPSHRKCNPCFCRDMFLVHAIPHDQTCSCGMDIVKMVRWVWPAGLVHAWVITNTHTSVLGWWQNASQPLPNRNSRVSLEFTIHQDIRIHIKHCHINYARYGLYYIKSMESLPQEVQSMFLQGHVPGACYSTWSDMFMRYGHSKNGLTGITLNDNATKWWALRLHICSQLISDLANMRDDIAGTSTHHKEESKARIQSDSLDRQKLREKLEQCIDPLDPAGHSLPCSTLSLGNWLTHLWMFKMLCNLAKTVCNLMRTYYPRASMIK